MTENRNCVEIVKPFLAELQRSQPEQLQIIGGTGSAALALADTVIVPHEKLIIAKEGLFVPQYRADGNKRDLDILELSSLQTNIDRVEARATRIIGDELEISVFGLKPMAMLRHKIDHPAAAMATSWLSDRYVEETGGKITALKKALFPFAIDVDVESLETWHLQIGDDNILTPVPHPAATLLNYLTRSISGLRAKDELKIIGIEGIGGLARTVLAARGMKDWMFDGPGKNLVTFAEILHGLRQPVKDQRPLELADGVRINPINPETLFYNHGYLYTSEGDTPTWHEAIQLQAARAKSRGLHFLESNPTIVKYFQRYVEKRAGKVVKNT